MADMEFPKGFIVKPPRDNAPDFVKGSISIKIDEFREWMDGREGDWLNLDLKESQGGKWYASVNTYKPERKEETKPGANVPKAEYDSDAPF